MAVTMKRIRREIPTYVPDEPNEMPFFFEKKPYQGATGRLYPVPFTDHMSNTPVNKAYDMVTLENEYIEVELLPQLGGKIHGATQKSNGYEFIYKNVCIKPALIGLGGAWVSGGVEFNWPQHHRPTTFMPVESTLIENADGSKTCWMGEAEPFHRMRAAVGITVAPGSSVLEAKAVVVNRTDAPLPFMWWNNLSVRVHKDYKATFPPDVEWGSDHDRRAIISFPVMKGVFQTARPFDYGEGTDVTWFPNVKLPTSVMIPKGQSDMDFLGGYDFAADAGTVTVADHHIAAGKKMWTWGDGDFGKAWCANLTDNGDRYIELMTGVYTDNQPDFTYIMPGETKTFSMVWYPVKGIGPVKNASRDAAMSFELNDGVLKVGAISTSVRKDARLAVKVGGNTVYEETVCTDPETPVLREVPVGDVPETGIEAALFDKDGKCLISYHPLPKGRKQKPTPRPIPPEPKDVESLEELYLHGAHLEQYKHHTFVPEDYYLEALRRDPKDMRCNHAMGRSCIEKGDFTAARAYLDKAAERLKMRNDNPADTEIIYQQARLERLEGHFDKAYDLYAAAAWQYGWRSACRFEMACISCRGGEFEKAKEELAECLETNMRHTAANVLLGYLTKDAQRIKNVLRLSPQDTFARFALYLMKSEPVSEFILARPQDVIDAALDFERAGFTDEAIRVLDSCTAEDAMILYWRAYLTGENAKHTALKLSFPNRLEDIAVLKAFSGEWQADYLLGCLYYDRMNYEAAVCYWEKSRTENPGHALTWRNLAQAECDHFGKKEEALMDMEKALTLAPDNARIAYELLRLYRVNHRSVKECIAYLEAHIDLVMQRDDCRLDLIILYTQDGQYERAHELLLKKRFNIYEGGEGKLTRHHGWQYTLMAQQAAEKGDCETASKWFANALVYPANYGEGRHYSAQEANIYYYYGLLYEKLGDRKKAEECWTKAADEPKQITEITYFAALSERKLGHAEHADEMLQSMINAGEEKIRTAHRYGYYGVGMASPLPFELDCKPVNTAEGLLLTALGLKGLGKDAEAKEAVKQLEKLDPYNFKLCFIRRLGIL